MFYTYLLPLYSCFYKNIRITSFGIILRNQNGEYIEVFEMELDGMWNIIIKIKNIIINSEVLIIFLIKSNYVFSISYILPLERFYFLFEK